MELPIITTKLNNFLELELFEKTLSFIEQVTKGDLYGFENQLWTTVLGIYNLVSELVLEEAAEIVQLEIRQEAANLGLGKLVERPLKVQIRTGHYVVVNSLYAKKIPRNYSGPRHLLRNHWKLLKNASPGYYSLVGLHSVLCPSYEVACHMLKIQGIAHNHDRVKVLSNEFAKHCKGRQAELVLEQGETLRDQKVLIGIDGGRTRMRKYTGANNSNGNPKFNTPWMEPKLFVIERLDDDGNIERTELPIYGSTFGDDEMVDLLTDHLIRLEIKFAKMVQIVADGATWIWNRIKKRLVEIGVSEDKIVETVDYYNASQYVHKLIEALPKKTESQKKTILKTCKEWLWVGNIEAIINKCEEYFKKPTKELNQYMGYLEKNKNRMTYEAFRNKHLVCGSGVVESGIRRIINLRFKNTSAFWYPENVESLYFLRGVLLSFRWNILIDNLMRC